jgi:hypothetical protein
MLYTILTSEINFLRAKESVIALLPRKMRLGDHNGLQGGDPLIMVNLNHAMVQVDRLMQMQR